MGFFKKNLLKVIEWQGFTDKTMVYKFEVPDRYEIMTGSKLVVRESQAAIFVHEEQVFNHQHVVFKLKICPDN